MTYFDTTLEAEPVAEQNNDPILPEERFIFELVGFERSQPDQWHKNGGIRWTFAVYDMDGHPFEFQDEHYMLWRTTNVNAAGKPLFTLGTQAHEFAQALLGRNLGVDDNFSISEMRGKRFSSQVVWQPKKTKPKEKAAVLASLRHIPMAPIGRPARSSGTATIARAVPSMDPLRVKCSGSTDTSGVCTASRARIARPNRLVSSTGRGNCAL